MTKRILIIGGGQLGSAFREALKGSGAEVFTVTRKEVNYYDVEDVHRVFSEIHPDYVINCAAFTDVNGAEEAREEALYMNAQFPFILMMFCGMWSAELIHFSTDYVFNGTSTVPYTEDDNTFPLNQYGYTKELGDKLLLNLLFQKTNNTKVFRVQAIYSRNGKNFYNTMKRLAKEKDEISVVCDQITVPTHASWIAQQVVMTLPIKKCGLWNLCPDGSATFAEFASVIMGNDCEVQPVLSEELPSTVTRPKYSVLDNSKFKADFGNQNFAHWKDLYRLYHM